MGKMKEGEERVRRILRKSGYNDEMIKLLDRGADIVLNEDGGVGDFNNVLQKIAKIREEEKNGERKI